MFMLVLTFASGNWAICNRHLPFSCALTPNLFRSKKEKKKLLREDVGKLPWKNNCALIWKNLYLILLEQMQFRRRIIKEHFREISYPVVASKRSSVGEKDLRQMKIWRCISR